MCVSVTRVFLVFFRQEPETTFEQCSFDFRIPRRHDVDGNFLLRSPHVLTLRVCSTTLVSFLCLRFNSTASGDFRGEKIQRPQRSSKNPFFTTNSSRHICKFIFVWKVLKWPFSTIFCFWNKNIRIAQSRLNARYARNVIWNADFAAIYNFSLNISNHRQK